MSENRTKNDELLQLLLSMIPDGNDALRERAVLLASFGNLKEAIREMETYIDLMRLDDTDLTQDYELLEKMKSHLN